MERVAAGMLYINTILWERLQWVLLNLLRENTIEHDMQLVLHAYICDMRSVATGERGRDERMVRTCNVPCKSASSGLLNLSDCIFKISKQSSCCRHSKKIPWEFPLDQLPLSLYVHVVMWPQLTNQI